jgi:hypothetical protein
LFVYRTLAFGCWSWRLGGPTGPACLHACTGDGPPARDQLNFFSKSAIAFVLPPPGCLRIMARPLGHDACLRHSAPQCTHQSAADAATHARVRDCRLDGALPGGNFKTYKAACVDRNADSIITACMHACKLKHALGHPEPEDRERSSRVVPNGGGCWARLYKTRAELWVQ